MRLPSYDEAQERFIIENAKDFTVAELAEAFGIKLSALYKLGKRHKLKFKKPDYAWCKASAQTRNRPAPKAIPVPVSRPAAVYTQIPSPFGIATEMRQL